MQNLKEKFLLDPSITFLNHGSFGATPKSVFAEYLRYRLVPGIELFFLGTILLTVPFTLMQTVIIFLALKHVGIPKRRFL